MKSLKLFNCIVVDKTKSTKNLRLNETLPYGFVLQPEVSASENVDSVILYYKDAFLSGEQLNKTFHKSWDKIKNSSREHLLAHQLMHYFSTYGLESLGLYSDDTIYIPNEVLEIPKIESLPLKIIKGVTKDELIEKCIQLLESGVALKEETITDVLDILKELEYAFKSVDNIKNKEAKLKISVENNIYPSQPNEFVRFLVYKATKSTLLIKDAKTISLIKESGIDVSEDILSFGLSNLSAVFLRFKPLFLAFKSANKNNSKVVNRLRRLSETFHSPMPVDYLNNVTNLKVVDLPILVKELNKVNNFRKIRLLYALQIRMSNTENLLYKVRNGKTWITPKKEGNKPNENIFNVVYSNLIESLDLKGKKIKYPSNIDYALPSTEKQFIGNIPTGTSFNVEKNAVIGIYWENSWGANDLDLSTIGIGKVGWNSNFRDGRGDVLFSGDVTQAPSGATELFYIKESITEPVLLMNNVYSGGDNCKFSIIVGQEKVDNLRQNYMLNPNNVLLQLESVMNQKQKVLGMIIPQSKGVKFVLTDFNAGNLHISSTSEKTNQTKDYLYNLYNNPISLKQILLDAGCEFVEDDFDVDLSVNSLDKDTILKLF